MSTHILAVGGFSPVHNRLKKLGARLTLMLEVGRIKTEYSKNHDRIIGLPASASLQEWLGIASTLHQLDPVRAIAADHEMDQDKAAIFADKVGIPFHSVETVSLVRQKDKMRERLRAAGVDPTQSQKVETVEEIKAFAETYGYPVILKPVDGWASIGVSLLRNPEDIVVGVDWLKKWSSDSGMLVEQYLDGKEFSVEAISEKGEHRILCITQKYKEPAHFVEVGHCLPAVMEWAGEVAIHRLVSQALTALGITNGASHTEIMVANSGPRIVETHTRLGGDFIPELFEEVSGIDLMELCAWQILGKQIMNHLPKRLPENSFAAIWYVSPKSVGVVERIEGEAEAKALPGVVQVQTLQGPGTELVGMHDSFSRAAFAIATGQSPDEAIVRAQEAANQLKFLVSCRG